MSVETGTSVGTPTIDTDPVIVEPSGGGPIVYRQTSAVTEFQRGVEDELTRTGSVEPDYVRDLNVHIFDHLRRGISFSLAWPSTWYIPAQADYRNYWILEPPTANRYTFGWGESQLYPAPSASSGSADTGAVFAYTALNPSDTHDTAFAGVAALYRPSATLAYADVSIDADVLVQSRIWMMLGRPTSNLPTAHIRCTAYACVWDIDPVTGAWQLVMPFTGKTLVNRSDSGLSGSAIDVVHVNMSGTALSTRVQVQGGHAYAVGFQAQVDIDCDVRDLEGHPYQRSDVDDWKLWADMTCSVPQITIEPTVLIH
jgi:hypothetical protein